MNRFNFRRWLQGEDSLEPLTEEEQKLLVDAEKRLEGKIADYEQKTISIDHIKSRSGPLTHTNTSTYSSTPPAWGYSSRVSLKEVASNPILHMRIVELLDEFNETGELSPERVEHVVTAVLRLSGRNI